MGHRTLNHVVSIKDGPKVLNKITLVVRSNIKMFIFATSEMFYPITIRGEIRHKNVLFRH